MTNDQRIAVLELHRARMSITTEYKQFQQAQIGLLDLMIEDFKNERELNKALEEYMKPFTWEQPE